jgi:hypothetical protein
MEAVSTLNEQIAHEVGCDMLALAEQVRVASVLYAREKAQVEYLDDLRKVVLAEIAEDLRAGFGKRGEKTTEPQLENLARASHRYKEFLIEQRAHKAKLAEKESQYYALRNRLDILLKQLDYAKAQMYLTR